MRRRVATACRAAATTTTVPGLRVPPRAHGATLIPTTSTIQVADSASSSVPRFETLQGASVCLQRQEGVEEPENAGQPFGAAMDLVKQQLPLKVEVSS
jgi:hypothetical protein